MKIKPREMAVSLSFTDVVKSSPSRENKILPKLSGFTVTKQPFHVHTSISRVPLQRQFGHPGLTATSDITSVYSIDYANIRHYDARFCFAECLAIKLTKHQHEENKNTHTHFKIQQCISKQNRKQKRWRWNHGIALPTALHRSSKSSF